MSQQASKDVESFHIAMRNWVIVVLLAAILTTQVLILLRIPASPPSIPTIGAWQNAETDYERIKLFQSIPLVQVRGTVDVEVQKTPFGAGVFR